VENENRKGGVVWVKVVLACGSNSDVGQTSHKLHALGVIMFYMGPSILLVGPSVS
jgi:hypothetical protein